MSDTKVRNAIVEGFRIVGHTPDTYDVDAFLGTLLNHGIHVLDESGMFGQMFTDRCDFECSVCHPEDDES